ncbi:MAG: hypothetical protein M1818_001862 [Claussenomyces sp. TS43310]|nr:MAG: hypothetical protein M1818_001862 [Claussenomyces sp. TS43310]
MVKYGGVGRHMIALEILDPPMAVRWAKMTLAAEWLYLLSAALPKLCIIALYLRIFIQSSFRMICYVLGVAIILTFVAGGLTGTLACQPLSYMWDKTVEGGHCANLNAFFRWISFPNILTDLVMLILPLPFVWKLHASTDQKIALTTTFLVGSLLSTTIPLPNPAGKHRLTRHARHRGMIASIIRFATFFRSDAVTDGSWECEDLIWTLVEPGIYLIAACLVTLRPLVNKVFAGSVIPPRGGPNQGSWGYDKPSGDRSDMKLSSLQTYSSRTGTAVMDLSKSLRGLSPQDKSFGQSLWEDERNMVTNEVYHGDHGNTFASVQGEANPGLREEHGIMVKRDCLVTSS